MKNQIIAIIIATATITGLMATLVPVAYAQECVIPQPSCAAVGGLNTANQNSNDHACPGLSTASQRTTGSPIPCG